MDPVPSLDDLTWLFETSPVGRYQGEDWRREWPFGAITFSTTRGPVDLHLYIEPGSRLAGLTLREAATVEVRLSLTDVTEMRVERLHGAEDLVIVFDERRNLGVLRLTMKPTVRLTWGNATTWGPTDDY